MSDKDLLIEACDKYGIEKILRALNVEGVTKEGKDIHSVCPIHNGDNPNAFFYKNLFFFCFTQCKKSYNIIDVVMHVLELDFMDAMRHLADMVDFQSNITYQRKSFNQTGANNRNFLSQVKKAKEVNLEVDTVAFESTLLDQFVPILHTSLRKEGFTEETRDYFDLGFATSGYLDNRITVPIDNIDGDIISVSGRSLMSRDEIDFTGEKKYKVWYGTDKGNTLYNISRALPYIELLGEVIVVEGFKDCFRAHQWGVHNIVAVMGSTITAEQKALLLKLNCKVIVCGDRDEAGQGLNKKIVGECARFTDVKVMNMFELDVPEASSLSDISYSQFRYLYERRVA